MYKIGTLSKKTGFSPNLLRAWEKRHCLLAPERGAGGQRLYPEEDLLLLQVVQRELARGRSIGELASMGRGSLLAMGAASGGLVSPLAEMERKESGAAPLTRFISPIVEAAAALDSGGLIRALDAAFSCLSADMAVHQVLVPAMREIGGGWLAGRISVAGEHLASSLVENRLRNLLEQGRTQREGEYSGRRALCSCFPEEQHRIGILTIAYRLACLGWEVVFLGASLPFVDLETALGKLKPERVWLSITREEVYRHYRKELQAVVLRQPSVTFILGGQAVKEEDGLLREAGAHFAVYPALFPASLYRD